MPNGWRALGEMMGGRIGTPGVYEDALRGRYDAERALQQARRERSLAMIDGVRAEHFQRIPGMAGELGVSDAEAALLAAGGGNAQQLTSGLGGLREQGFRQAAAEAAALGDVQGANAQLFGVANAPVQVTGISDGVAYNRLAAPGEADLTVTQLQNRVKAAAVALPCIPPLVIGVIVFASRRLRERENISKSRLK